jgi:hypothetical protein
MRELRVEKGATPKVDIICALRSLILPCSSHASCLVPCRQLLYDAGPRLEQCAAAAGRLLGFPPHVSAPGLPADSGGAVYRLQCCSRLCIPGKKLLRCGRATCRMGPHARGCCGLGPRQSRRAMPVELAPYKDNAIHITVPQTQVSSLVVKNAPSGQRHLHSATLGRLKTPKA